LHTEYCIVILRSLHKVHGAKAYRECYVRLSACFITMTTERIYIKFNILSVNWNLSGEFNLYSYWSNVTHTLREIQKTFIGFLKNCSSSERKL